MTLIVISLIKRGWYLHLHPGRLCKSFRPDGTFSVYCFHCGYDIDLHRKYPKGLREGISP